MFSILQVLVVTLSWAQVTAETEPSSPAEAIADSARQITPATIQKRSAPAYPASALRAGQEGWVKVAFCIDESGKPQNVSVLDSMGSSRFERAAVNTVKKWRYEPALADGEPSWQSRNEVYITFAMQTNHRGATSLFARKFRQLGELIDERNLAEADELFNDLYENYDLSLYEQSKLWAQRVRHESIEGDLYKLDRALHRATASDGKWIDEKSYRQLLELQVMVRLQLGRFHSALVSYNKLRESAGDDSDAVEKLKPAIRNLQTLVESDELLKIEAEVRSRDECDSCNDSWNFTPLRNAFTIANVSGSLENIEMRCDQRRYQSAISDEVDWSIPESWGTCNVRIYGEPGTTFDVVLLPEA
ncbi:MAG: energy transducer TonB [Pseudomonadota bacterium]